MSQGEIALPDRSYAAGELNAQEGGRWRVHEGAPGLVFRTDVGGGEPGLRADPGAVAPDWIAVRDPRSMRFRVASMGSGVRLLGLKCDLELRLVTGRLASLASTEVGVALDAWGRPWGLAYLRQVADRMVAVIPNRMDHLDVSVSATPGRVAEQGLALDAALALVFGTANQAADAVLQAASRPEFELHPVLLAALERSFVYAAPLQQPAGLAKCLADRVSATRDPGGLSALLRAYLAEGRGDMEVATLAYESVPAGQPLGRLALARRLLLGATTEQSTSTARTELETARPASGWESLGPTCCMLVSAAALASGQSDVVLEVSRALDVWGAMEAGAGLNSAYGAALWAQGHYEDALLPMRRAILLGSMGEDLDAALSAFGLPGWRSLGVGEARTRVADRPAGALDRILQLQSAVVRLDTGWAWRVAGCGLVAAPSNVSGDTRSDGLPGTASWLGLQVVRSGNGSSGVVVDPEAGYAVSLVGIDAQSGLICLQPLSGGTLISAARGDILTGRVQADAPTGASVAIDRSGRVCGLGVVRRMLGRGMASVFLGPPLDGGAGTSLLRDPRDASGAPLDVLWARAQGDEILLEAALASLDLADEPTAEVRRALAAVASWPELPMRVHEWLLSRARTRVATGDAYWFALLKVLLSGARADPAAADGANALNPLNWVLAYKYAEEFGWPAALVLSTARLESRAENPFDAGTAVEARPWPPATPCPAELRPHVLANLHAAGRGRLILRIVGQVGAPNDAGVAGLRGSWLVAEGEFDAAIAVLQASAVWMDAPAGVYAALVAAHALSGSTVGLRRWAGACCAELGPDHPFSVASMAVLQSFAGECEAARALLAGPLADERAMADADLLVILMGIADVACQREPESRQAALADYRQLRRGDGHWFERLESFSRSGVPR